ncbi:hypothetical protein CDAR_100301 [Caerostris darwini]|uniref:Uncharacterized protein n=1 Tax=Caerostris darwini TaxID=1538125 RepID=A0AAV4NN76_9ARAC|nr:hypothetical protein CDAR_100301 [Caerostris darwini]
MLKAFRSHVQRSTKSKCKTRCCFTMLGNWQPLKGCFRQRICWVEYRPESRLGFADQVDPVRFRKILWRFVASLLIHPVRAVSRVNS